MTFVYVFWKLFLISVTLLDLQDHPNKDISSLRTRLVMLLNIKSQPRFELGPDPTLGAYQPLGDPLNDILQQLMRWKTPFY